MTDDTLREECRALADIIPALFRDEFYKEKTVDMILAFARAQQAKGLREAAEILHADNNPYVGNCVVKLEAQATAREGEARDKPVGMLSAQELNERWEKWHS